MEKAYIAIDLKSFYASVECVDRGLDPLGVNLVVADLGRTQKTICLAVSPALKAHGIGGRPRLFEVVTAVREINTARKRVCKRFTKKSYDDSVIKSDKTAELDYIVAMPRMARYMEVSSKIYNIYLKYVSGEDIHVYSVDEVFIDATSYLRTYNCTARELAMRMINDVLSNTGITATAGIGTNMFLSKVAMDIEAKHAKPDENGVRIAELDQRSYRERLWTHRPLTDFWRIGRGYSKKLEANGLFTMGDIARLSATGGESLLYKLFGINAELLIDHAWGWEPCTIKDVKAYRPDSSSISSGQVLKCGYDFEKGRLIVREMTDQLALKLVEKGLVTDQLVLVVGYDAKNLEDFKVRNRPADRLETDRYGRLVPKQAHGSAPLGRKTSSSKILLDAMTELYERIVDRELLIRRVYVIANRTVPESECTAPSFEQLDFFTDISEKDAQRKREQLELESEKKIQKTVIDIKNKYGKNAILKGMNLKEGATATERNSQIGGHKA